MYQILRNTLTKPHPLIRTLSTTCPILPSPTNMTPSTKTLAAAILSQDENIRRVALSRAITLIESNSSQHALQAELLLNHLLDHHAQHHRGSFRIGIAGPPGAGKSTFIETLGRYVLGLGSKHHLAVLCIDPSSSITGGSILGDKTRMMELSRHPRAFVRPSPNRGTLGGLSSTTNDAVSLCAAAGYDLVVVETVGLGQSEVEISHAVDCLVLLIPPGGGDSLQGVKKGIVEVADIVVVNKADGDLLKPARITASDYKSAVGLLRRTEDWGIPPVLLASAHTNDGVAEVWEEMTKYYDTSMQNGFLPRKRFQQGNYWMWKNVQDLIIAKTKEDRGMLRQKSEEMEQCLEHGRISPRGAARELLNALWMTEHSEDGGQENSEDGAQSGGVA